MSNVVQLIARTTVPPRLIPLVPCPADFRHSALEIQLVLSLVKSYLETAMTDAARHAPGCINLPEVIGTIDAKLSDLSDDMCGGLERAAEDLVS